MQTLLTVLFWWGVAGIAVAVGNYLYWKKYPDLEDDTKY